MVYRYLCLKWTVDTLLLGNIWIDKYISLHQKAYTLNRIRNNQKEQYKKNYAFNVTKLQQLQCSYGLTLLSSFPSLGILRAGFRGQESDYVDIYWVLPTLEGSVGESTTTALNFDEQGCKRAANP